MLKSLKEKSLKRKKLLAQTVGSLEPSESIKLIMKYFQLGVSEIEDITSVLGDNSTSSKTIKDDESEAGSSKKLQTESLFYKDSSLFLKVCSFAPEAGPEI